jgi:hypothetical protein
MVMKYEKFPYKISNYFGGYSNRRDFHVGVRYGAGQNAEEPVASVQGKRRDPRHGSIVRKTLDHRQRGRDDHDNESD